MREVLLASNFTFNIYSFSSLACPVKVSFRKEAILCLLPVFVWPEDRTHTKKNCYSVTSILVCCVILRRSATPTRWKDSERLSGKWGCHLSEISWEGIECLVNERMYLITSNVDKDLMARNAKDYSDEIYNKCPE